MLGLDRGGACRGLAFRIPADAVEDSLSYLRARELVTHVYRERQVRLVLDDARTVEALTYTEPTAARSFLLEDRGGV